MMGIKYYLHKTENLRFFKGIVYRAQNIGLSNTLKEWKYYFIRYRNLITSYGFSISLTKYISWQLYVLYNYSRHAFLSYDAPLGFIEGCVPMGDSYKYLGQKIGHYEYLYQQNDKVEFYRICDYLSVGYPKVFFYTKYNKAFDFYGNHLSDLSQFNGIKMFVKPTDGASGIGAYVCDFDSSKIDLTQNLLFGAVEANDSFIKSLSNVTTYNTVRIQSYLTLSGDVEINCAFLKLSFDNSVADNIAQGGMGVGIDPLSGVLFDYGLDEETKTRYAHHPNSNVLFAGKKIPFWNRIIKEITLMHNFLGGRWIGWDIGISEDGPVYIEANSGGGMLFQQSACKVNFYDQQLIKENLVQ
jgi:hypothetical protein